MKRRGGSATTKHSKSIAIALRKLQKELIYYINYIGVLFIVAYYYTLTCLSPPFEFCFSIAIIHHWSQSFLLIVHMGLPSLSPFRLLQTL
jgi:hypothetical protein